MNARSFVLALAFGVVGFLHPAGGQPGVGPIGGGVEATGVASVSLLPAQAVSAVDRAAARLMQRYSVPGVSLAMAKNGQIVFAKAYGWADVGRRERLLPSHVMRLASVSKPLTAVAVMKLVEAGRLGLDARVFGPGGVLGTRFGRRPYAPRLLEVTVRHLLQHTAGGWGEDPVMSHPELSMDAFVGSVLDTYPLRRPPGTRHDYSNFGYIVLGRVLEAATNVSYEEAVQRLVLRPAGLGGFRIGSYTRAGRLPAEVIYYSQDDEDAYGASMAPMDADGGWVASAVDVLGFVLAVDGLPRPPDVLGAATLRQMVVGNAVSPDYGLGWGVDGEQEWSHMGAMPGTSAYACRLPNGVSWVALANSLRDSESFDDDFVSLMDGALRRS